MEQEKEPQMLALIKVRGNIDVKKEIVRTMDMLHLDKKNTCVVVIPSPSILGMIAKSKDFITYGEISEETLTLLNSKKKNIFKNEVFKGAFRLNPPKKGFGTNGIKKSFKQGGALGDRKEKINDLIKRMI